ncbi:MAG TPA: hypothetical protein VNO81_02930 [Candidatus Nitrosotenuis sp.]|nr:hypothetical protein [Candidatus Nitrosotenuis sp.]
MALVSALLASCLLLLLGLAFLSRLQADRARLRHQQARDQAFYLARAGLEHYGTTGRLPGPRGGRLYPDPARATAWCEIQPDPRGRRLFSTGVVVEGAPVRRTLVVEGDEVDLWREVPPEAVPTPAEPEETP